MLRDVTCNGLQERPHSLQMGRRLFVRIRVLDRLVFIPESLQHLIPRRKLRYVAQRAPSLQPHRMIVPATTGRRN